MNTLSISSQNKMKNKKKTTTNINYIRSNYQRKVSNYFMVLWQFYSRQSATLALTHSIFLERNCYWEQIALHNNRHGNETEISLNAKIVCNFLRNRIKWKLLHAKFILNFEIWIWFFFCSVWTNGQCSVVMVINYWFYNLENFK